MTQYKLIALDLDGTLLTSALKLSDTNAAALKRVLERGVQVVFATSRWFGLAKRTADRLGIDTPLICSNGALIRRPSGGAELLHLYLDPDLAREVTTLGDERGWEMFTTIEDATYMKMRPGVIPEMLPAGLRVAERQSDHVAEGRPTCVLLFGDDAVQAVAQRFLSAYDGRANFSLNRPQNLPHYAVLTHPDAEKARALDLVCRDLGVPPEDTLAMGDSESDLAMLRWAGLGIAMANAPDEVQRAALHIAPSNDDDGVAWAVEKFVL
ncbi:MAG TPA: Cof-type HAD-IIB family hydrolase [Dehalococcoidia bacterium]|nr:Cof-type HAD-IIB family hydrolase [Dehalococcoidia bacterium]